MSSSKNRTRLSSLSLLAGALLCSASGRQITHAQEAPSRIEVVSRRFAFQPGEITLHKGHPVVFVFKSEDVAHGLRFRELNLEFKVEKGHTKEVPFTPEKTGDFVGHCSVFCGSGHGSMVLTLHVVN